MSERRRHERRRTHGRALVKSRWLLADAAFLDASAGGCQIRTGEQLVVGEQVELSLELPDGSRILFDAKVVRQDPRTTEEWQGNGYGLQILDMDDEARERLQGFIEQRAAAAGNAQDDDRPGDGSLDPKALEKVLVHLRRRAVRPD